MFNFNSPSRNTNAESLTSRKGKFTSARIEQLRQAALARRPWEKSTGPKTVEGKARSAANGRRRQKGALSVREKRAMASETTALMNAMRQLRQELGLDG